MRSLRAGPSLRSTRSTAADPYHRLAACAARREPRPEIAYLSVHDVEPATIAVSWPRDSHSPSVAAFVRTAILGVTPPDPKRTDNDRLSEAVVSHRL